MSSGGEIGVHALAIEAGPYIGNGGMDLDRDAVISVHDLGGLTGARQG